MAGRWPGAGRALAGRWQGHGWALAGPWTGAGWALAGPWPGAWTRCLAPDGLCPAPGVGPGYKWPQQASQGSSRGPQDGPTICMMGPLSPYDGLQMLILGKSDMRVTTSRQNETSGLPLQGQGGPWAAVEILEHSR